FSHEHRKSATPATIQGVFPRRRTGRTPAAIDQRHPRLQRARGWRKERRRLCLARSTYLPRISLQEPILYTPDSACPALWACDSADRDGRHPGTKQHRVDRIPSPNAKLWAKPGVECIASQGEGPPMKNEEASRRYRWRRLPGRFAIPGQAGLALLLSLALATT